MYNGSGVTLSYWQDREAIKRWKQDTQYLVAQKLGSTKWHDFYRTQIARVETSPIGNQSI